MPCSSNLVIIEKVRLERRFKSILGPEPTRRHRPSASPLVALLPALARQVINPVILLRSVLRSSIRCRYPNAQAEGSDQVGFLCRKF